MDLHNPFEDMPVHIQRFHTKSFELAAFVLGSTLPFLLQGVFLALGARAPFTTNTAAGTFCFKLLKGPSFRTPGRHVCWLIFVCSFEYGALTCTLS